MCRSAASTADWTDLISASAFLRIRSCSILAFFSFSSASSTSSRDASNLVFSFARCLFLSSWAYRNRKWMSFIHFPHKGSTYLDFFGMFLVDFLQLFLLFVESCYESILLVNFVGKAANLVLLFLSSLLCLHTKKVKLRLTSRKNEAARRFTIEEALQLIAVAPHILWREVTKSKRLLRFH